MYKVTFTADAFNAVLPAVAKEDNRYALTYLFLNVTHEPHRLVGCDGHRLAIHDAESWDGDPKPYIQSNAHKSLDGILIPVDGLKAIPRTSTITFEFTGDGFFRSVIKSKSGKLAVSLIELDDNNAVPVYPSYQSILDSLPAHGAPMTAFGINPQYLVDPVAKLPLFERRLSMSASTVNDDGEAVGSVRVTYPYLPDLTYIVMPVRI